MLIGIIGSDHRAVAIGRVVQRAGHSVSFSSPAQDDHAEKAAQALGGGAIADSAYHQASVCEAVVMAIHWEDLDQTLNAMGPFKGTVIDAMRAPVMAEGSGAEMLAKKMDNRHIVKAFVETPQDGEKVAVAGDDPTARALVEEIIAAAGCYPVEMGPLVNAAEVERGVVSIGEIAATKRDVTT